jgi:hypothetical protein
VHNAVGLFYSFISMTINLQYAKALQTIYRRNYDKLGLLQITICGMIYNRLIQY